MKENEIRLEEMGSFFDARSEDYDQVHVGHIGGIESKKILKNYLPEGCGNLIDLGIGTGLELEAIYERFPDIKVTGIDLSREMLKKLQQKYPDKEMKLICGSYFDFDMGCEQYDAALTVMTLHYTHEVKTALYRRIYESLRKDGIYVESDYMITDESCPSPQETEDFFFSEYERLKKEQSLNNDLEYHYDTPCTEANQIRMLKEAGFRNVREVWKQGSTVVLTAQK